MGRGIVGKLAQDARERGDTSETNPGLAPKKPTQGKTGLKLGSPEWVEWMKERKAAAIAERGDAAKGGQVAKPTREQAKQQALEKLVPKAIKELEKQLTDEDPKIRQTAAIKILEWGKGKPRQTIENVGEQTTVIRYETSAIGADN